MKKPKLENGEEWKCRECGVTTAPFTSHKKHKEILEAIDEINYGEVLKSNVFVKDKFEIKGKVSKLVENGEVIERFEKKFGFNLWKEVQGFARGENEPAEVKVGKGWINISNDVKQFIYYALNQQRESLIKEIREIKVPPYPAEGPQASIMTNMARMGYQDAIIDILTKLEEEK